MCDKPHDNWAEVYDEVYTATFGDSYTMITRIALEIIQEKTELGAEILDIGAGTGRLSIPLLQRGYSVSAVDASTKMLDVLKRKDADGRGTKTSYYKVEVLLS
jgi:2-polyprenyl-3-methyl-5-hydroxy-6-metoxy-1,4-benzoquinol methylase